MSRLLLLTATAVVGLAACGAAGDITPRATAPVTIVPPAAAVTTTPGEATPVGETPAAPPTSEYRAAPPRGSRSTIATSAAPLTDDAAVGAGVASVAPTSTLPIITGPSLRPEFGPTTTSPEAAAEGAASTAWRESDPASVLPPSSAP